MTVPPGLTSVRADVPFLLVLSAVVSSSEHLPEPLLPPHRLVSVALLLVSRLVWHGVCMFCESPAIRTDDPFDLRSTDLWKAESFLL